MTLFHLKKNKKNLFNFQKKKKNSPIISTTPLYVHIYTFDIRLDLDKL